MKRTGLYLILCCLALQGKAQSDSALVQKFLPDSTGFSTFPQVSLLDSVRPSPGYAKWELNIFSNNGRYSNLYRNNKNLRLPDSVVLTKSRNSFYTFCPPGGCGWYLSARKDGRAVSIGDMAMMSDFIGRLDNAYDAYLWLVSHQLAQSRFIPVQTRPSIEYKRLREGYLFRFDMRIHDCPVTSARVTYFVRWDKKILLIKTVITAVGEGCI
jgi:hypothetical protein